MSGTFTKTLSIAAALLVLTAVSLPASVPSVQAERTLKDRIEYGLETSAVVKKYDIKVTVLGDEATLSGQVATEAQKTEAARLAKVAGAAKIQNAIVVDPRADTTVADRMKSGLTKTGEKITDAWITTKVKWFFMGDDLLKGSDINVDTANHVVTLKGTVKSAAGRSRAVALAKDTDGVRRVVDNLTIAK